MKGTCAALVLVGLGSGAASVAAPGASGLEAKAALESLKKLAGDWEGHLMTADGPPISVSYAVTSAGSVVMERLAAGTDHEMVSMYHLDGKDLVMTHYCAAGNQPRLRWNPATSSANELSFDFVAGSNMDPALDAHMHSGRIVLKDANHVESVWIGYAGGKPAGEKRFILTRKP